MYPILEVVCGPQEAHHVMGWAAGERNLIFYAYNRRIGARDPIWVQDALTVSVAMFKQMGLKTTLEKKKALCDLAFGVRSGYRINENEY